MENKGYDEPSERKTILLICDYQALSHRNIEIQTHFTTLLLIQPHHYSPTIAYDHYKHIATTSRLAAELDLLLEKPVRTFSEIERSKQLLPQLYGMPFLREAKPAGPSGDTTPASSSASSTISSTPLEDTSNSDHAAKELLGVFRFDQQVFFFASFVGLAFCQLWATYIEAWTLVAVLPFFNGALWWQMLLTYWLDLRRQDCKTNCAQFWMAYKFLSCFGCTVLGIGVAALIWPEITDGNTFGSWCACVSAMDALWMAGVAVTMRPSSMAWVGESPLVEIIREEMDGDGR